MTTSSLIKNGSSISDAYVGVPVANDTHETKSTSKTKDTVNYWGVLLAVSLGIAVSTSIGIFNEVLILKTSSFWQVVVKSSAVLLLLSPVVFTSSSVTEDEGEDGDEDETDGGEDKNGEEGCDAIGLYHLFLLGFTIHQLYLLAHQLMQFTLFHILVDHEISDASVKAIVVMNMVISRLLLLFASMRLNKTLVFHYLDKAKSDMKVCTAEYVELNV
jgi:hypothetical protein